MEKTKCPVSAAVIAAAILLASPEYAKANGLKPRARVLAMALKESVVLSLLGTLVGFVSAIVFLWLMQFIPVWGDFMIITLSPNLLSTTLIIALLLGDGGIPPDVEGRLKVARHILERARAAGVPDERVYIDPLAMAIATQNAQRETKLAHWFR